MKKENGFYPGGPPFVEFKKDMIELLNDAVEPLKKDMTLIRDTLVDHINSTKAELSTIKTYLSNHVTDTDKKIDSLKEDIKEIKRILSSKKD